MERPLRVILGITGSIAAYKAAHLLRLLVKQGAEVQVLMTPAATGFIAPLTMGTLSGRSVYTDVRSAESWNNHVELGLWADVFIVAPASANTLSKMASGQCDSVIGATYLSARCPVVVAPAMDVDMWHHPSTRRNIAQLQSDGVHLIPVGHGALASGLVGEGRMAEPEDIVAWIDQLRTSSGPMSGKQCLVTAGPTHEPLDPVRFIGNHSTGKMGIALADELARRGAMVDLVLGPTHLRPKHPSVRVTTVQTAQQMFEACSNCFEGAQVAVLAAAVADYKPSQYADQKIKKSDADLSLPLARTVDIAATLGKRKQQGQIMVGFALETEREIEHAKGKMERKQFDAIVMNSLRDPGAGFGSDTNKVTILYPDGREQALPLQSKAAVAVDIVNAIAAMLSA
jgi:phosphopantothenoylcysteine decarboxylase/phosphopantothenate--cysteine ligase